MGRLLKVGISACHDSGVLDPNMQEVASKVQMYVGTRAEMEFSPDRDAVLFRDKDGNEIRLDPLSMRAMAQELSPFVALLERIGVKTK
jgi:hypothetical protein